MLTGEAEETSAKRFHGHPHQFYTLKVKIYPNILNNELTATKRPVNYFNQKYLNAGTFLVETNFDKL